MRQSRNNGKKIKEMILITAGWGQICPDRSDMLWHISWYLATASPPPSSQNTLSMLGYEMTRTRHWPVIFHHRSSVFLSSSNYFLRPVLVCHFYWPSFDIWDPLENISPGRRIPLIQLSPVNYWGVFCKRLNFYSSPRREREIITLLITS